MPDDRRSILHTSAEYQAEIDYHQSKIRELRQYLRVAKKVEKWQTGDAESDGQVPPRERGGL